jgi:YidC/Oxa1 family membrane protein insertase
MQDFFLQLILGIYNTIAFHNLGVTIILMSVATRIVFYPFNKQQMQMSKKMAELAPHISALKAKHKDNKQAFAQAQMDLYKQHGVNPAAGCLPSIVQIVVLFALLGAFNKILSNKVSVNTMFLMWNLTKPDAYTIANVAFKIPGILVILAAATQFIQTRMMMPIPPKVLNVDKPKEKEEKKEFQEEFAEAQSSMMWMFPLMFLLFGTQWPSGLALYWSTSSALAIAQQYKTQGLGGLEPLVAQFKKYISRS